MTYGRFLLYFPFVYLKLFCLYITFLLLFPFFSFASDAIEVSPEGDFSDYEKILGVEELQAGDILLQPLYCYFCFLIEDEESTPYAHMGVLIEEGGEWFVLEAFLSVRKVKLSQFIAKTKKNQKIKILRHKEWFYSSAESKSTLSSQLLDYYYLKYAGNAYDDEFLWNNITDDNQEKLYCSELAVKLLDPFVLENIQTKSMHFIHNRKYWIQFFKGEPPDGAPGVSPGDFERSSVFRLVGFIM